MVDYNKVIAAAHMLFFRDGKFLMLRRFQTGWRDGEYSLPAGHVEKGETAMAAALREAAEEVGVIVCAEDCALVHVVSTVKKTANDRINFFFMAKKWSGEFVNNEPHKCDDLRWVSPDALPENTVDYIRDALGRYAAGSPYSEFAQND